MPTPIPYYITHLDVGGMPDFSQQDGIVKANDINDLRRKLIKKYVVQHTYPLAPQWNYLSVYDGLLKVEDDRTGKRLGILLFDKDENGRAYWVKKNMHHFFYPVSAKTGRITGEGMDYFRSSFKKKKR